MPGMIKVAAAIEATGRKKLIIAGISLEVCAAFPAITAIGKGSLHSFGPPFDWRKRSASGNCLVRSPLKTEMRVRTATRTRNSSETPALLLFEGTVFLRV